MSSAVIEHTGVVIETQNNIIKVLINAESACASCHAKGACSATDMEEKIIDVPCTLNSYVIGDQVLLSMKPSYGFIAIFYAYVLPFLVLLTTLISTSLFYGELTAGLLALAVLIPYYSTLYFFRKSFVNKFSYLLKKL